MSFVVFVLLQLADLATTLIGLNCGALEANPIALWMIRQSHSIVLGTCAFKLLVMWGGAILYNSSRAYWLPVLNWMFLIVVYWNIGVLLLLLVGNKPT